MGRVGIIVFANTAAALVVWRLSSLTDGFSAKVEAPSLGLISQPSSSARESEIPIMTPSRYAVLFDLLTALLDSWSLWNAVAGSEEAGRRWRAEYLRITYRTGAYRSYEDLVAEAAEAVGMPRTLAAQLDERYGELRPWPGVTQTLQALAARSVPLGIVTNCSERLGRIAANCVGVEFATVITAERAGFYKPDPRPYRLGLEALGVEPARCLFVAGSAYDLVGTAQLGLATYWHDRIGMAAPEGAAAPLAHERTLDRLPTFVGG